MRPVDLVVQRLDERGCGPRRSGAGWSARCPTHEDRNPSLSVHEGADEKAVLHCHAGCAVETIVEKLDLAMTDLFLPKEQPTGKTIADTYDYLDESGTLLFQTVRFVPKGFRQRRSDGNGGWVWDLDGVRRIPYRLPELRASASADRWVLIGEGEKAVDRLTSEGFIATCSPLGAGKWRDDYAKHFEGRKVVLLPDNDDPGRDHARQVARSLYGHASVVKVVELDGRSEKDGADDWLDAGHTAIELRDLVLTAPGWDPAGAETELRVNAIGRDDGGARARLIVASSIRLSRPTWVYEGRIPKAGVTLLAGREGLGKTVFAIELAARVTRGQLHGDCFGVPGDIVYLGAEDDRSAVLNPRLTAAGADLDRVHFLQMPSGSPFAISQDITTLDELLATLDNVALVIIDPLDSHLGETVDSHKKAEVQRAIGMLAELAQKYGCGTVGIGHLNKGDARDLLARVVGSVGFTTAVRSVIGIGEHPEDESHRVAVLAKSNLTDRTRVPAIRFRIEGTDIPHPDEGVIDTARVVWLGEETGFDPDSIVSGLGSQERTERDLAVEWLEDFLSAGRVPYREIERCSREEDIKRATLHRAAKKRGVVITRDENTRGRPSTWALPDSVSPIPSHPHTASGETKSNPFDHNGCEATERVSSHVPGIGDETLPETEPEWREPDISKADRDDSWAQLYAQIADEEEYRNLTDDELFASPDDPGRFAR